MPRISHVTAREILDSRGFPTIEVDLHLDNGIRGRASVPSGASRGLFEAHELRDADDRRFLGRGVLHAVRNVTGEIGQRLKGFEAGRGSERQKELDELLISLDGTPNKSRLGANALLAVSLAYAKASALAEGTALFRWISMLAGTEGRLLPVPMMNILNGGRHADNSLDIQEFMIVPVGPSFREALRVGVEVFHHLRNVLKDRGFSTNTGDEGGFAPDLKGPKEALDLLVEAAERAGYRPGQDLFFALDAAANEFFDQGKYRLRTEEGTKRSVQELVTYYETLARSYPLVSLEDGLGEEDWEGWAALTRGLGSRLQLVGDDLFVTNVTRLNLGIERKVANAILIKPNQVGTVSETLETVERAKAAGYRTILSHRSGETEDTALADLAVGLDAAQIKTGGPSRSERLAKYNRLLQIEEELGSSGGWRGLSALR